MLFNEFMAKNLFSRLPFAKSWTFAFHKNRTIFLAVDLSSTIITGNKELNEALVSYIGFCQTVNFRLTFADVRLRVAVNLPWISVRIVR